MEINIGFVIQKLRKLKGLTQEQVADAIGISKAAVSKWESGNTYPDITLLAPLARLLDTSINELLEFNSKLTEKEINSIVTLCELEFLKGDYFSAYDYCEKQLKKYTNIAELKLRIASLYWQYTVLLKDDEEASNNMIKRACEVFEEASETSKRLNQKSNDTMLLLANIYDRKGENDNAKKMYQRILFKNIQTCGLVLQNLSRVAEKESNIKDAQLFLETVIKLNTLFEFENHGDACAVQLAELYAKTNDRDKAIAMLNRYIRFINNLIENGNKGLNGSKFFSEIPFKSVRSEKSEFMKQHLAEEIINTPAFDTLKENEEFKKIIEELKSL